MRRPISNQNFILQIKDLEVTLGHQPILEYISFEVARNSIHAVIGPNGAGKTTFIRSLLGGMPHRGEIRFWFQRTGKIGYVPQLIEFDHGLPMTVGDFLCTMVRRWPIFFGTSQRTRREISRLLALTGTEHLIDRMLGRLSGGEFRRVLLAQALSPTPELLLLDEPASNVDEQGARVLETLLHDLKASGVTTLMVGHDLAMIGRVADQVTAINRRVTFCGSAQALADPEQLGRLFGTSKETQELPTATQMAHG